MSDNIYAAPQADLTQTSNDDDDKDDVTLATRWSRLWSSLIDSLTIMAVSIPAMYFTGGFELIIEGIQPSFIYNISIAALSITVFFIINFKLLKNQGQTIGKKTLKIKIVDLNGNLPDFKRAGSNGHTLVRKTQATNRSDGGRSSLHATDQTRRDAIPNYARLLSSRQRERTFKTVFRNVEVDDDRRNQPDSDERNRSKNRQVIKHLTW